MSRPAWLLGAALLVRAITGYPVSVTNYYAGGIPGLTATQLCLVNSDSSAYSSMTVYTNSAGSMYMPFPNTVGADLTPYGTLAQQWATIAANGAPSNFASEASTSSSYIFTAYDAILLNVSVAVAGSGVVSLYPMDSTYTRSVSTGSAISSVCYQTGPGWAANS